MELGQYDLSGKVAVVTGGGTGLGREMSIALAEAGADVAVAARRLEPLMQTAAEIERLGRKSLVITADVTRSQEVERLVEATLAEFGTIDILVNNAGIAKGIDALTFDSMTKTIPPIWEITDEMWRESMDVNLNSVFFCTRAVARHMAERKTGKIINMASGAGIRAVKGNYTYSTSKAGVIHFTRVAAVTLAEHNIGVNAIAPVFLMTLDVPQELVARREKYVPFGRAGRPDEIGGLAVYLASEASDYVTGALFVIDGAGLVTYAPSGYTPIAH